MSQRAPCAGARDVRGGGTCEGEGRARRDGADATAVCFVGCRTHDLVRFLTPREAAREITTRWHGACQFLHARPLGVRRRSATPEESREAERVSRGKMRTMSAVTKTE